MASEADTFVIRSALLCKISTKILKRYTLVGRPILPTAPSSTKYFSQWLKDLFPKNNHNTIPSTIVTYLSIHLMSNSSLKQTDKSWVKQLYRKGSTVTKISSKNWALTLHKPCISTVIWIKNQIIRTLIPFLSLSTTDTSDSV